MICMVLNTILYMDGDVKNQGHSPMSLTTKLTLHSSDHPCKPNACILHSVASHCSMVMLSVTCHSPSVAAKNTTEQLTCVFTNHIVISIWGGGGVGG